MNFPFFGDADFFLAAGAACAKALANGQAFADCYNGLRPIGSYAYFTLPNLLAGDAVAASYVLVGMNVLMFILLCSALKRLFQSAPDGAQNLPRAWTASVTTVAALVLCTAFIPVALSDMPALSFFMLGLAALFARPATVKSAFLAGLFLALAGLVKQNYYVFSAMAFGVYVALNVRTFDRGSWRLLVAFSLGYSVSLLQVGWVYLHTGRFYLYDPSAGNVFDAARKFPNVELVAFSLPSHSAYMSAVDRPLTALSHFCIKLLYGFFAYRPAVYLGISPGDSPAIIRVDRLLLLKAYLSVAALVLGLVWGAIKTRGTWRAMLLLTLFSTLFTTWYIHVENRYFVLPKLLLFSMAGLALAWVGGKLPALYLSAATAGRRWSGPGAVADRAWSRTSWPSAAWTVFYVAVVGLCFLLFQQQDLLHTVGSSHAYLLGHWSDFYEYNAALLKRNDYLPLIYAIFALWMIPFRFTGLTDLRQSPIDALALSEVFWAKLLLVVFFAASAMVLRRIAVDLSGKQEEGRRVAVIYLTAPLAVFAVFIFGQYDVIALFLLLCGLYYYLRRRYLPFAGFFSLAISFKYFALVPFIPLLLMAQAGWRERIRLLLVASAATILQFVAYGRSKTFLEGILFQPRMKLALEASNSIFQHPLFYGAIAYAVLCIVAARLRPRDATDHGRQAVMACAAAFAIFFSTISWHPQWLILAMPFFALASLYVRRVYLMYAAEVVGVLAFAWLCANYWPDNVDSSMVQRGALRDLFPVVFLHNADIMSAAAVPFFRWVFILFLVSPLVLFFAERRWPSNAPVPDPVRGLGARFVLGMAILVVPSLYCAFASERTAARLTPTAALARSVVPYEPAEPERTVGEIDKTVAVRQTFHADRNGLAGLSVRMATYARLNGGTLRFTVTDSEGNVLVRQVEKASRLRDNQFYGIAFAPLADSAGRSYALTIDSPDGESGNAATAWMSSRKPWGFAGSLQIGGKAAAGVLIFKLHYAPAPK